MRYIKENRFLSFNRKKIDNMRLYDFCMTSLRNTKQAMKRFLQMKC